MVYFSLYVGATISSYDLHMIFAILFYDLERALLQVLFILNYLTESISK